MVKDLGSTNGTYLNGQELKEPAFLDVDDPANDDFKRALGFRVQPQFFLLNENGEIIAQHDALDVRTFGLKPGDELAQLHTIPIPADTPPGTYELQIGLYQAETLERLSLLAKDSVQTDSLLFGHIEVNEP